MCVSNFIKSVKPFLGYFHLKKVDVRRERYIFATNGHQLHEQKIIKKALCKKSSKSAGSFGVLHRADRQTSKLARRLRKMSKNMKKFEL